MQFDLFEQVHRKGTNLHPTIAYLLLSPCTKSSTLEVEH